MKKLSKTNDAEATDQRARFDRIRLLNEELDRLATRILNEPFNEPIN